MLENADVNSRDQHIAFWENTFKDFWPRLIAYALRLANGRMDDAEDLVQEAYCRILSYSKNPAEIENLFSYLSTIIRNIWSTKWRKERRADTESLDELLRKEARQKPRHSVEPAVAPDVLRTLENDELRDELRLNQGPLTPREKRLLKMYLEGFSCKESADLLGEDVRLIRVELNAMKTKVRNRLMKRRVRTRKSWTQKP